MAVVPHGPSILLATRLGKFDSIGNLVFGCLCALRGLLPRQYFVFNQAIAPSWNWIPLSPIAAFVVRAVLQSIAKEVSLEAIARAFNKRWTSPAPGAFDRSRRSIEHG